MKNNKLIIHFILSLFIFCNNANCQELRVFSNIPGRVESNQFLCRVRKIEDAIWKNSFVLQTFSKPASATPVSNGYTTNLTNWSASWISFEFSGCEVEVEISLVSGAPINIAMVRPKGEASAAKISNGKAYIKFQQPTNINVDINNQMEGQYTGMGYTGPPVHTISIFANPIFKKPNILNPRVISINSGESIPNNVVWDTIYFKPGIHNIGQPYQIASNKVLYIPGDAILKGTIHPPDLWGNNAAKNWSVYGSGTISGEDIPRDQTTSTNKTFTRQAQKVRLEGFVVVDPAHHTFNMNNTSSLPENVNIYKNLKILGWRINGDGLNAFHNSEITNCFFRCQDDHFYYGGDNMRISNCVTWSDFNGSTLYVTKGAAAGSTSYFKDCKVIYHRAGWHYWQGGRVISFRDRKPGNVIKNVNIKNVLIEDPFPAFPPFYFNMINPDDSSAVYDYENIVIENVQQLHPSVNRSQDANFGKPRNTMNGLDSNRKFENITFKNCMYNTIMLGSFLDGNFLTNTFNQNIIFQLSEVCRTQTQAVPLLLNNNWTYFGQSGTTNYLFAIEHKPPGGNTADFTATIEFNKLCDFDKNVFKQTNYIDTNGFFIGGFYWNIMLDSGSTNGFVNIRVFPDFEIISQLDYASSSFKNHTSALYESNGIYFKTEKLLRVPLDMRPDAKGLNYTFKPLLVHNNGSFNSKLYVQFNEISTLNKTGGGILKRITNWNQNFSNNTPTQDLKGALRYNIVNDKYEGFDGIEWRTLH